jgi:hypothetical protein
LKAYIPKPIILYDFGVLQTVPSYIFNSANYMTYNAFGNETSIDSVYYSLNFGAETSPLKNVTVTNSLFNQYYQNYLTNIYNPKGRTIKVKAILPISILTTINLNDRLVITDKRYLINSYTTNLVTGETELELVSDFRTL